jgi:hypothetical protein
VALFALAALAAVLVLAPSAGAHRAANLSLNVNFFTNGTITVTLPDGTPVGTTSGAPTTIPAGYYAVMLNGPGGCTALPHFILKGPGENIVDNMTEGEVANFQYNAYFLPSSTYTWSNDASPSVVHTFATTADVQGTAPTQAGSKGIQASNHGTAKSVNPFGSDVLPLRGSLSGAVSAAGALTLSFKGQPVSSLKAGRYTVTITDGSKTSGFVLMKGTRAVTVTNAPFVGKHTGKVSLTAGKWVFTPSLHGKATAITVKG